MLVLTGVKKGSNDHNLDTAPSAFADEKKLPL